jgi:uncharacterized membrane protein
MIIQVPPDAPAWVHVAASGVLYVHIGAGFVSLASGATAILARKGERLHRAAGTIFFAAMLLTAAVGAATAPFLPQIMSSVVGALTFYLVATAWVTVKRPENRIGRFEVVAMLAAAGAAATGYFLGWQGANSPNGEIEGAPYQAAYAFASIAALAAACDLKVIVTGGVAGRARITRHLWRMSTALLIATLSFVGQPRAFPEAWRGSPLLFAPILIVLALTAFWLVRARFTRAFDPPAHLHSVV